MKISFICFVKNIDLEYKQKRVLIIDSEIISTVDEINITDTFYFDRENKLKIKNIQNWFTHSNYYQYDGANSCGFKS